MSDKLLPTTVVGSYVQPDWLVDKENLRGRLPPRVRAHEIWKLPLERMVLATDCGIKYIPRDIGFGKLCAMVSGADVVRKEPS